MNREETLALLAKLEDDQHEAEAMMLIAMIRANDWRASIAALGEAVATTGLRVPVSLFEAHGEILGAIFNLHETGVPLSAESVAADLRSDGYDVAPRFMERIGSTDPDYSASEWGRRLAEAAGKRLKLGQQVWPEALYRWFDWDDRLLYVGITRDMAGRQESHSRRSSWGRFAARCTVERYPDREMVEAVERWAIEREQPLFNHVYNDTPEARQRLVAYLVERGHLDLLAPAISRG